jgi:hypothetical protein
MRPRPSEVSVADEAATGAPRTRQKARLGLHQILAHSRHRHIATLMTYVDEHDRRKTQATLADRRTNLWPRACWPVSVARDGSPHYGSTRPRHGRVRPRVLVLAKERVRSTGG